MPGCSRLFGQSRRFVAVGPYTHGLHTWRHQRFAAKVAVRSSTCACNASGGRTCRTASELRARRQHAAAHDSFDQAPRGTAGGEHKRLVSRSQVALDLLLEVAASPNVAVHLAASPEAIDFDAQNVALNVASGGAAEASEDFARAMGEPGACASSLAKEGQLGANMTYDLLIGADGSRSKVRGSDVCNARAAPCLPLLGSHIRSTHCRTFANALRRIACRLSASQCVCVSTGATADGRRGPRACTPAVHRTHGVQEILGRSTTAAQRRPGSLPVRRA
jgi:hypothetical protein